VGLEARRFWIVPPAMIDGVHCAYMGPSMTREFEKDIPHMRDMVSFGFSQAEIGKYYGLHQSTVFERLQMAGKPKAEKKYVGELRKCENQWDRIIEFGQPVATEIYESTDIPLSQVEGEQL